MLWVAARIMPLTAAVVSCTSNLANIIRNMTRYDKFLKEKLLDSCLPGEGRRRKGERVPISKARGRVGKEREWKGGGQGDIAPRS